MEVQTGSRSLVPLRSRVPEILGGFHLDDHNVDEWSDTTNPALQHRARQEKGKWINPERNADIQYQKREDSKKFEGGEEKQRTEVIEGKSPESAFQIIRTHRQVQDAGEDSSGAPGSRVISSSTSYQMSSSRGMRSTVKTTSNKTTSKTVTVTGGRTDDFETLKMSFQPLDSSTQRERINMSRSGTMVTRRPPTKNVRRQQAATAETVEEPELINTSENITSNHNNGQIDKVGGLSILGFKNLSPKIRVGFPVEIQLELQTKLRVSSTATATAMTANGDSSTLNLEEDNLRDRSHLQPTTTPTRLTSSMVNHQRTTTTASASPTNSSGNIETAEMEMDLEQKHHHGNGGTSNTGSHDSANLLLSYPNRKNLTITNNEQPTFDFSQRRKSYGFESFDSRKYNGTKSVKVAEPLPLPLSHHKINSSNSNHVANAESPKPIPLPSSHSWDLIQNVTNNMTAATTNRAEFQQRRAAVLERFSAKEFEKRNGRASSKSPVRNNELEWNHNSAGEESDEELCRPEFTFDSLEDTSAVSTGIKSSSIVNIEAGIQDQDEQIHRDNSTSPISPASERSRKLMKILDETPDLLNKMSFRNYFSSGSPSQSFKSEPNIIDKWNTGDGDDNDEDTSKSDNGDWERQKRQLNFLSDSLNRILDSSSNSKENRYHEGNRMNTRTTAGFSDNSRKLSPFEPTTNGSYTFESEDTMTNHETRNTSRTNFLRSDVTDLDENDVEVDHNANLKRASPRVSQTWIFSGDMEKPIQEVRDQDVTTTISATCDSFRKPFKRVEFCKTEVHFTADSGKFHIVETDENKPSTVNLYRRKKRSDRKTVDILKSLDPDTPEKPKLNDTENNMEISAKEENIPANDRIKTEDQINASNTMTFSEKCMGAGALLRPAELPNWTDKELVATATIKPIQSPPCTNVDLINTGEEKIKAVANGRLMMNLNLNLALDVGEFDYDDNRSPSHTILSKYGDLKIQRYLKQLTSPSSLSASETSEMSIEQELNPLEDDGDEDPSQARFDNNVLYENGSFVPMATRKSLIEMNNRNRKRSNQTMISHASDHSSTASNYSLPNSESNLMGTEHRPLKLTAMEAIVRTAGAKPQITSVELRYSANDEEHDLDNSYHPKPYMPEPIIVPQLTRENYHRTEDHGKVFQRHIPFAVMPPEISNPPYRNDPYYHSPSRSPSKSPTRNNAAFRNPKPPTPVLPIQFSTFEKTGAALRERFYSKNPSCGCHNSGAESDSAIVSYSLLGDNNGLSSDRYTNTNTSPNRTTGVTHSKSVVTISSDDKFNTGGETTRNNISTTEHGDQKKDDQTERGTSSPEPILSMDHTWKGPAHFETQSNSKGTSLTRSMTFPKSTRPEPEWVSKAKSRESRVMDWNLVGKPYGTNRKSEPPWISEIRFKNKTSSVEEIKSLPKISIVYPWQRESVVNEKKESGRIAQSELEAKSLISISLNKKENDDKGVTRTDNKLPPWKSLQPDLSMSTTGTNKSIVDLNRDSDSILINPPQIEVKPMAASRQRTSKSKHFFPDNSVQPLKTPPPTSLPSSRGVLDPDPTNLTSVNGVKILSSVFNNSSEDSIPSNRKPLQASTITNKTNNTNTKSPSKPPKPPQRTSSLVKTLTTGFCASLDKKPTPARRVIAHLSQSNSEDSPGSSRSNTPIHRHPTIKISKLPTRNLPNPGPDGKQSPSKNKTKTHVSLMSEAKRICSPKSTATESTGLIMKNNSMIQNQNQSPTPVGGRTATSWSNSIKTQQGRQGLSGSPSNKKLT